MPKASLKTPAIMPMPRNLRPRPSSTPAAAPKPARRTSEQVEADKKKKAAEKVSHEEKQAQALQDVAHHEHMRQKEDEERFLRANHPPPDVRTKTPRPQQEKSVSDDVQEDEADTTLQADSPEMLLDDSDDEEQSLQKTRKPAAKEKPPTVREKVDALKTTLLRDEAGATTKRKGAAKDLTVSKKPRQGIKSGLRSVPLDDDTEDVEDRITTLLSISSKEKAVNNQDSEDEEVRGITDTEGDPVEKAGVAKDEKSAVRYSGGGSGQRTKVVGSKVHSVAKIEATTSVPEYVSPLVRRELTNTPKPKAQLRDDDLPSEVSKNFDEYFGPRLYEYFGRIRPWSPVKVAKDKEICRLWERAFPDQPLLDSKEPEDAEFIRAVQSKVEGRLGNWRNKLTAAAADWLSKTLIPSFESKRERAEWVNEALGEPNVWHNKPFYYKSIEIESVQGEGGEEEMVKYVGLFQSPFIARVFGVHYQYIKDIPLVQRSKEKPTGALVMAVQACLHNLSMYKTGERVTPFGKLSHFCADNCDDRKDITDDGLPITIKATTKILKTVKGLTESQWKKVISAAVDTLAKSVAIPAEEVAPSSDVEMIDDDEDI